VKIGYSFESMTRRLRILLGLLVLASSAAPLPALAQSSPIAKPAAQPSTLGPDPSSSDRNERNEPKTKEQLEAQQHFQRAKDLYQTGAYREAIAELEQARGLDPTAKDLVFNLGIVHEKIGKLDEAITFFRQYMEMEGVSGAERAKAENIIKRIEGAKREVPVTPPTDTSGTGGTTEPPRAEPTGNGRIDAATVTAASVAVVGLGVGATFGILALSNRPKPGAFVTGRDGTYDTLQTKTSDAHTQAIVADIGFGVGITAVLVTAYLYFGRSKETAKSRATRTPARASSAASFAPSFSASASGGSLLIGGTFQ
jgi:tetratricopeptide (TPR) repeat protein